MFPSINSKIQLKNDTDFKSVGKVGCIRKDEKLNNHHHHQQQQQLHPQLILTRGGGGVGGGGRRGWIDPCCIPPQTPSLHHHHHRHHYYHYRQLHNVQYKRISHEKWIINEVTVLLVCLFFISFIDLGSCSPLYYCHRLDAFPRRLYATKTSYDDVRSVYDAIGYSSSSSSSPDRDLNPNSSEESPEGGGQTEAELSYGTCAMTVQRRHNESLVNGQRLTRCHENSRILEEKTENCEPVSFYLLARHGTRYNKVSNMDAMTKKLQKIRDLIELHASTGFMCDEDLHWMKNWQPRHSLDDDSKLSTTGWNEVLGIGQRYGDLFPTVLRRPYSPYLYEFRYTNYTGKGDRTRQSARAFAQGLWGSFENVEMIENPRPDWLLQFYEHCQKYLRVVGGQPVEDYEAFKNGREMAKVVRDVNRRLGLPENTLGFPEVYLIFENCRLEHGLYRDSPWCSVLTPSMLEVIEYHQDVKYYWEDGYGHSISYEPACTLIHDILLHLEDDTKRGRFRFAHSGTLDSLYTRIGLYEDKQPLRANNYDLHRSHRLWTTSKSTPMAANIAFVKYRCLQPPSLRVKTFVNEDTLRPVLIPGCSSVLCPLETLRELWTPIARNCDIERICEQSTPTTTPLHQSSSSSSASSSTLLSSSSSSSSSSTVDNSNPDIIPLR